jgi:hypothetical protein
MISNMELPDRNLVDWCAKWFDALKHERGINPRKLLEVKHDYPRASVGSWFERGDNGARRGQLPWVAVDRVIEETGDVAPIVEWGRRHGCAVYALADPKRKDSELPKGLKELNDLVQTLHHAKEDGRITKSEVPRIRKEAFDLINWALSVVVDAEAQAIDDGVTRFPKTMREAGA